MGDPKKSMQTGTPGIDHHKDGSDKSEPLKYSESKPGKSLAQIAAKELAPGLSGHYIHGSQLTLGVVYIKNGSNLPLHQHENEQVTYIVEGELQMTIGTENLLLTAGMAHVIPSNIPHSAVALTDCKVIDVFNPVRQDYKQQ